MRAPSALFILLLYGAMAGSALAEPGDVAPSDQSSGDDGHRLADPMKTPVPQAAGGGAGNPQRGQSPHQQQQQQQPGPAPGTDPTQASHPGPVPPGETPPGRGRNTPPDTRLPEDQPWEIRQGVRPPRGNEPGGLPPVDEKVVFEDGPGKAKDPSGEPPPKHTGPVEDQPDRAKLEDFIKTNQLVLGGSPPTGPAPEPAPSSPDSTTGPARPPTADLQRVVERALELAADPRSDKKEILQTLEALARVDDQVRSKVLSALKALKQEPSEEAGAESPAPSASAASPGPAVDVARLDELAVSPPAPEITKAAPAMGAGAPAPAAADSASGAATAAAAAAVGGVSGATLAPQPIVLVPAPVVIRERVRFPAVSALESGKRFFRRLLARAVRAVNGRPIRGVAAVAAKGKRVGVGFNPTIPYMTYLSVIGGLAFAAVGWALFRARPVRPPLPPVSTYRLTSWFRIVPRPGRPGAGRARQSVRRVPGGRAAILAGVLVAIVIALQLVATTLNLGGALGSITTLFSSVPLSSSAPRASQAAAGEVARGETASADETASERPPRVVQDVVEGTLPAVEAEVDAVTIAPGTGGTDPTTEKKIAGGGIATSSIDVAGAAEMLLKRLVDGKAADAKGGAGAATGTLEKLFDPLKSIVAMAFSSRPVESAVASPPVGDAFRFFRDPASEAESDGDGAEESLGAPIVWMALGFLFVVALVLAWRHARGRAHLRGEL